MSEITPIALTISGDEKAVGLAEVNMPSPKKGGKPHRYQIIYVIRDDKVAEFRRDLGLVTDYKGVRQINIPGLLEHTVDELIGLADELRYEMNIDVFDWLGINKGILA
jgi:hypothetical protein